MTTVDMPISMFSFTHLISAICASQFHFFALSSAPKVFKMVLTPLLFLLRTQGIQVNVTWPAPEGFISIAAFRKCPQDNSATLYAFGWVIDFNKSVLHHSQTGPEEPGTQMYSNF